MKFRLVSAGLLAKQYKKQNASSKFTKLERKSSEFKIYWQFSLKWAKILNQSSSQFEIYNLVPNSELCCM